MIGKICIVRCRDAGVHVGRVEEYCNRMVRLTDSRRIWRWAGANTLNELSVSGLASGRISDSVPEIVLLDACEILPISETAKETLTSGRWDD